MKPPVKPNQDDCCGSGCNPCIFDAYEKKLQIYNLFLENGKHVEPKEIENGISQLEYTKCSFMEKIDLLDSHYILKFKLTDSEKNILWRPGDHFLFKYINGDFSCTRAYTPLTKYYLSSEIKLSCGHNEFIIIVKMYYVGLVSKQICYLYKRQSTLWRGPYGQYEVVANKYKRIVMIAQGTGIAPFLSIVENVLNNEDDMTKLTLYFCCKSMNSLLFRHELYEYQSFWNFTYKVFLNEAATIIKYNEPIENCKFNKEHLNLLCPFNENDQFLLCGSLLFMETYKNVLLLSNALESNIVTF